MGQYITDTVAVEKEKMVSDKSNNSCAERKDDSGEPNQEDGKCTVMMDVLDMFIDVSALVREKSGFTQYANHCYTVDKDTEKLIIELTG